MAGTKSKNISDNVADLARLHGLDQVVVFGWREKDGRYVMVAHGRDKREQVEAEAFAKRLMKGSGAPSERTDRYYGSKKANEG